MKTHRQLSYGFFSALTVVVALALPGIQPAVAKDTDVYLKTPAIVRDDAPNVLIILDNSGSMETNSIPGTKPAYDPATNYCAVSGAPAGNICNGTTAYDRIFWTINDLSNPPSATTDKWFNVSENNCLASASALGTLGTGLYQGDRIGSACPSCTNTQGKNWSTLENENSSTIDYVDCQNDNVNSFNSVADGTGADDGTYPKGSGYAASGTAYSFPTGTVTSTGSWGSPKLLTANYLAYLRNSSLASATQTRMQIAKNAVKSIIDSYKNVRLGLMVFNANDDASSGPHGGRLLMKVDNMDDARRTTMKSVVDSICGYRNCATSSNPIYTPLAETMWEAYRYLAGLGVDYGDDWTTGTPARDTTAESGGNYISPFKYGCQKAFIILVTDGGPTHDVNADSNIKGLSGLSTSSCVGYNGGSLTTAATEAPKSCLKDLAGWMATHDVPGVPLETQVVITYTVGFATSTDTTSGVGKLLNDTATAGKGKYKSAANYDELALALDSALSDAFEANASFSAPSLSINAFNKLYNRDDVYFALFTPEDDAAWDGNIKKLRLCSTSDTGCTFGEIIDATGAPAIDILTSQIKKESRSQWSSTPDGAEVTAGGAGEQITQDSVVPRTLYTYYGTYTSSVMTPVAIEATAGNTVYDAAIADKTILGLSGTASDPEVAQLINWMRGQDVYDADGDSNTTETRRWNFADPLHSRPVAVTYGAELDGTEPDPDKPIIKLFAGTNDGMVRMLSDATGEEEWAFIPQELLENQHALALDSTGDLHPEGMDDTPTFLIIDNDKDGMIEPAANDKVYMYIGMRRGGKNLYAFDVTPASTMTTQNDTVTPKLLWVISGGSGDFAKLSETWSRPKMVRVRAKCNPSSVCDDGDDSTSPDLDSESRLVLIFGGGYSTNQDGNEPGPDSVGNAIYIVDPFTGARLWWASDAGANLNLDKMKYSIPSEITALDTNGDKSVDRLYVGDTGGQVWRIDLGSLIGATGDAGSSGYVFADVGCGSTSATERVHNTSGVCPAGTTRQDLRKFFYPPDVAMVKDVTFSNTPNYDLVAIGSGDREDPLDLLTTLNYTPAQEGVHNRMYAFRDYNYKTGKPAGTFPPSVITEKDMYDATDNLLGTLTGSALDDEINNNVKDKKGWYIDLKEASKIILVNTLETEWVGEKVLAKPVIFDGTLFFTTFIPANDSTAINTCKANEGEGRYYEVNYLNATPVANLRGGNDLDRYGIAGGGIPSEVIIVIREDGVSGLVGTSGGAKQVDPGGGTNRYKTFWWDE